MSGLDDSDKYDCTREGYVAISNPFRVSDIVESGEARDYAEGRGMASAYFAALVQNVQQGTPFEGSLFERAYTKGFVADADWRRLNDNPERMLDAIDGIAKKVARAAFDHPAALNRGGRRCPRHAAVHTASPLVSPHHSHQ